MSRPVLSPTLGRTGEDFPRKNGSNFAVWNARVRAALDGQGLLGFIDQEDYDGDSDSSVVDSDDEDPDQHSHPPSPTRSEDLLSDTGTLPFASSPEGDANVAEAAAQPKADGSSSETSSDSSSGNSSEAMETDSKSSKPSAKPHPSPPVIKNFTETKKDKEIRRAQLRAQAKKARAKLQAAKKRAARMPSSHERRRRERKLDHS